MMKYETDETLTIKAMDVITEHGLTIEDLIGFTGFSKATITKFVKGKRVSGNTVCVVWNNLKKLGYASNYKWNGYQEVKC